MRKFIFFTLNDFTKDGGGTIRMKGIVNALANDGQKVWLVSNATSLEGFHESIEHIHIGHSFTKKDKRLFQLLLTLLPFWSVKKIYKQLFYKIDTLFKEYKVGSEIIFFEHLDNSIGYALKRYGTVDRYINDTHGIAVLEFSHKTSNTMLSRMINNSKAVLSKKLDKKVFTNAHGLIFVSEAMKNYFMARTLVGKSKVWILRDGVNNNLCEQVGDVNKIIQFKKEYHIDDHTKVVFFAGNFKDLGGVLDLLRAFLRLLDSMRQQDIKLLLVGNGECYADAKIFVKKHALEDKVVFAGRILYDELRNYQELADVIVCPDKQHPFSELVPHIKYFDSLASGKVVINGSFTSVKEINKGEKFSVDFEPSNVTNLANKIEMVLQDMEKFSVKYKENKKIICSEFTYRNFAKVLIR